MTIQEKLNYLKELRAKATQGMWKPVRNHAMGETWFNVCVDDEQLFSMKSDLNNKLNDSPDEDFVSKSANEWNNIITALKKAVEGLEYSSQSDRIETLSEIRKLLEAQE